MSNKDLQPKARYQDQKVRPIKMEKSALQGSRDEVTRFAQQCQYHLEIPGRVHAPKTNTAAGDRSLTQREGCRRD